MSKKTKARKVHLCVESDRFEVLVSGYPHAVFRCKECFAPMRSTALDDLEEDRLDFALEMLARFRRYHQEP